MGYEARLESLRTKHQDLERMLQLEERRPFRDEVAVATLKRQKLRIKDEIERISH